MNKLKALPEAIKNVPRGVTLGLGGMILYRRPVAAVMEIIRQGIGDLTLLGWTLGFEGDLLIGAGLVDVVRTSYFGLESFGLAPMFRSYVERGKVRVIEESESTLGFGFRAALQNVGFMPAKALIGTDILKVRPDLKLVTCPYTQETYPAMPAIKPDVTIVHALKADSFGNAVLFANLAADVELALLAQYTIITTEEVVDTAEIENQGADIIGKCVDAVVHVPGGALPTSCYPLYPIKGRAIVEYIEACQAGSFSDYLESLLQADDAGKTKPPFICEPRGGGGK